jgi:tetrahydrodipicolinate N-succinyltransferase
VKENDYYENKMKKMKKTKNDFKHKQIEMEKTNFDEAARLQDNHSIRKTHILN